MLAIQRRRTLLHLGMGCGSLYQQHFRFATLPNIAKHTSFRKYHQIQMHPCTAVLCLLLGRLWRTWVSLCGTGSARSWSTSLVRHPWAEATCSMSLKSLALWILLKIPIEPWATWSYQKWTEGAGKTSQGCANQHRPFLSPKPKGFLFSLPVPDSIVQNQRPHPRRAIFA